MFTMGMTKPKQESTPIKGAPIPKPSFPLTTKSGETAADTHIKTPPQTKHPPATEITPSPAPGSTLPSAPNVHVPPTTGFKSLPITNVRPAPTVQPSANQGTLPSGKKDGVPTVQPSAYQGTLPSKKKDGVAPSKEDSKRKQQAKVNFGM